MRCPRCGNENPATNRFCGTCGTSLVAPSTSSGAVRSANSAQASGARDSATSVSPAASSNRVAPPSGEVAGMSAPSILGLNAPPPTRSRSGPNLQHDAHHAAPSRSLDYLLDDEEEHRGGAWKILLILIALALALGFGYWRWQKEGLPSLWQNKPSTAQSGEAPRPPTEAPTNAPEVSSPAPAAGLQSNRPESVATSQPAAATESPSPGTATVAPNPPAAEADAPRAAADQPTNAASPPRARILCPRISQPRTMPTLPLPRLRAKNPPRLRLLPSQRRNRVRPSRPRRRLSIKWPKPKNISMDEAECGRIATAA